MAKFPTYTPGTFYVVDAVGKKVAGGKDFATLDLAIAAAKTSTRRSVSNARGHGATGFDVMEVIPGRHTLRAVVNVDLSVEVR